MSLFKHNKKRLTELCQMGLGDCIQGKMSIEQDMDNIIEKLEYMLDNEYYGQWLSSDEFDGFTLDYDEGMCWVSENRKQLIVAEMFASYQLILRFTIHEKINKENWKKFKTVEMPLDLCILESKPKYILSFYIIELKKFIRRLVY